MKTVTDQLCEMAEEIKVAATDLLETHSGLERDWNVNNPDSECRYFSLSGSHDWRPLDEVGQQLQSKIRKQYDKFLALLRILLRSQQSSVQETMIEQSRIVYEIINQEGLTCMTTTEEAISNLVEALDGQIAILSSLYDGSKGRHIYVPDTNGLLHNPQLEEWDFDGSPNFVVLLTPTVLSELDHLKVNHRNENLRQKAEGLIRRIKGYRARGQLIEGVPLRKARSTLATIAVEPRMEDSLPWLDAGNNDDRILAGFIEVMREHPRCQVILVTRDMNLQNKAEYAGLPFVEPPDPPTTSSTSSITT